MVRRDIITPQQIYPALQVLLGLPDHCVSFELRVAAWQCGVTVACEHYVALDAPGLKQRESVFSQYELLHRSQPDADSPSRSAVPARSGWRPPISS